MARGRFITFEGIEGCGKSTQMGLARQWLEARGIAVEETREPGGTPLGQALRALLLDPAQHGMAPEAELFLYLADRAQNVRKRIVPGLEAGRTVLCDRHADATLAYQGIQRGIGLERARELNRLATGGILPDRTFVFDLPAAVGLARVARRRAEAGSGGNRLDDEPTAFHEGVRRAYLDLAAAEPRRFVVIDGSLPEAEVHARVAGSLADWY